MLPSTAKLCPRCYGNPFSLAAASAFEMAAAGLCVDRPEPQSRSSASVDTRHQYHQPRLDVLVDGGDQGTAWREPQFDDSAWISGLGLFGFESSPVYPYPFQTIWQPMADRTTYYARTHFHWEGNWPDVLLRTTNYIDDGAVFFLNGRELGRLRMPTNIIIEFNTPAQPPTVEGRPDVLEFRTSFLHRGDNVLAVEIHNASPVSGDIVFGLSMEGIDCHFDFPAFVMPPFQTVEQCQSATITLLHPHSVGPGVTWMKDGVPLP